MRKFQVKTFCVVKSSLNLRWKTFIGSGPSGSWSRPQEHHIFNHGEKLERFSAINRFSLAFTFASTARKLGSISQGSGRCNSTLIEYLPIKFFFGYGKNRNIDFWWCKRFRRQKTPSWLMKLCKSLNHDFRRRFLNLWNIYNVYTQGNWYIVQLAII